MPMNSSRYMSCRDIACACLVFCFFVILYQYASLIQSYGLICACLLGSFIWRYLLIHTRVNFCVVFDACRRYPRWMWKLWRSEMIGWGWKYLKGIMCPRTISLSSSALGTKSFTPKHHLHLIYLKPSKRALLPHCFHRKSLSFLYFLFSPLGIGPWVWESEIFIQIYLICTRTMN